LLSVFAALHFIYANDYYYALFLLIFSLFCYACQAMLAALAGAGCFCWRAACQLPPAAAA
jgi:NADH:ubiquinone oxidoreductase subunit 6 (subunit J)